MNGLKHIFTFVNIRPLSVEWDLNQDARGKTKLNDEITIMFLSFYTVSSYGETSSHKSRLYESMFGFVIRCLAF